MPSRGTPLRGIRVGDGLWARFGETTKATGLTRAEALRAFILWFCRYPGAELPDRPEAQ